MCFIYICYFSITFRFDGQFVLSWLIAQGNSPEIIPNGSKVMTIILSSLNIKIIDSFNFLPMGLSRLPACFGFNELKKGYFPHWFNTKENQKYVGNLPEPNMYGPDSMSISARETFLKWYEDHKNDVFDFQKEMLEYCR